MLSFADWSSAVVSAARSRLPLAARPEGLLGRIVGFFVSHSVGQLLGGIGSGCVGRGAGCLVGGIVSGLAVAELDQWCRGF